MRNYLQRQSAGAYTTGKITEEQRLDVVRHACPGHGACGGMYTCVAGWPIPVELCHNRVPYVYSANTMSACMEVLGMTLPGSSSIPAVYPGGHCDTSRGKSYIDDANPQINCKSAIARASTLNSCWPQILNLGMLNSFTYP